jgi:uncharacterized OB-fold protein
MTDVTEAPSTEEGGPVRFMQQHIALDYVVRVSPIAVRFAEGLERGVILGRRCPSCSLVFVPLRTFCNICTVAMDESHELEVTDRGTVTAFTILTPIQYHGQQERNDYALASILLDGADGTVGQQRLLEVPMDQVRTGLRVQAVWAPEDERGGGEGGAMGFGFGEAITGWQPTGEPDADPATYEEHAL